MKKILGAAGILLAGAAALAYSQALQSAVRDGLLTCLTALAPSLFPFLALTELTLRSGAGEILSKPLGGICRRVLKLPACCAAPVLLGWIGGYPAGARGAALLLEEGKIDREEAGRMLLFCVNPGPAFVISYVGGAVLGNVRQGGLLCLAGIGASLLLGAALGLRKPTPPRERLTDRSRRGNALVPAVAGASRATLTLCAWVVLFSGAAALLREAGILALAARLLALPGILTPPEAAVLLQGLLEVTGGVRAAAELRATPALLAFGLGFGGLCVHLQVISLLPALPGKLWRFWAARLAHGLLAAGLYTGLSRAFPTPAAAGALQGTAVGSQPLSGTWMGGLSLLVMCGAFLWILGEGIAPERKM